MSKDDFEDLSASPAATRRSWLDGISDADKQFAIFAIWMAVSGIAICFAISFESWVLWIGGAL